MPDETATQPAQPQPDSKPQLASPPPPPPEPEQTEQPELVELPIYHWTPSPKAG